MVEAVLSQVPLGTPVDQAQRFMEQEGFHCTRHADGDFGRKEQMDFVWCERSTCSGWVEDRWRVFISYCDGKVANVTALRALTGP